MQLRARRTRERLIEAAVRLFAGKGSLETTFDALAEAAGVSRGSIRFHFGSKEGLLFAVVDRVFAEWESEVLEPLLGDGAGPARLSQVVEAHRDFVRENEAVGRLFFVLLFEALGPRPELRPRFAGLYERFRRHGRTWLRGAQESGGVVAELDPDALTTVILGALGGLHYQWQLDPERAELDRAHATLTQVLERALRP